MAKSSVSALDAGLLVLRVFAGLGMAYHGYGKVFGGNMAQMAEGVGKLGFPMPLVFAWAAALAEFVGGLFWVLGLGTRVAAFFILSTMVVAFFMVHAADPFQVKELAAAYGVIAAALLLTGGGSLSIDRGIGLK